MSCTIVLAIYFASYLDLSLMMSYIGCFMQYTRYSAIILIEMLQLAANAT